MHNENSKWYAVSVNAAHEAAEAIEFAFNELDALGTEINHLGKRSAETLTVVGYFQDLPSDGSIADGIKKSLDIYNLSANLVVEISTKEVVKTDWLAEWKKHWKPTFTNRFIISPPWEEIAADGKFIIKIEPNMAFGTGTHETTRLCLKAVEELYSAPQTFLDVGTGTGILAIAAAMINTDGPKMLACDTDVDSITIARENAAANGVAELIDFYIGSIDDATPEFDFVCANLTIDVILPILSLLTAKTKKTLVLSGILREQENQLKTALTQLGNLDCQPEYDGEWMSAAIDVTA